VMYNAPALYGVEDYKHGLDRTEIDICTNECIFRHCPCDQTVYDLCELYVMDLQLTYPLNADEARLLYKTLRDCIKHDITVV